MKEIFTGYAKNNYSNHMKVWECFFEIVSNGMRMSGPEV